MLIELLKINNISITDFAKELGVSVTQIRRWDKNGILETNPHWNKLHCKFPSLKPKPSRITKKGTNDKRGRDGHKKQLKLTDTSLPSYVEPEFKSSRFPNIKFIKKDSIQ